MKTILFIGTNKSGSSRDAIIAAKQLGYYVILFTKIEKQIQQRAEYPDVHQMIYIDTDNLSEMKEEIKRLRYLGVDIKIIVSFVDSYVYSASLLCDEFCKNQFSSTAIRLMNNKKETRTILRNQPYNPAFEVIKLDKENSFNKLIPKFAFPVMVKASSSTGSKDVLMAENEAELKEGILTLQKRDKQESIIIEEYIEGDQYLVETLVYQKKVMIVGILQQEITRGERFIVTGYGVLADVPSDITAEIEEILYSIVNEFGIINGALHLEIRRTANGWRLIEINPRISGGAMNRMIRAAFGFNLVKETLKLQLGGIPSIAPKFKKYVFTQYKILEEGGILEKVTGKGRARKSPGVVAVYIKPKKGTLLFPPLSMGHRYAYAIATGKSMDEAKQLAKNAINEIKFHLKKK